MDLSIIITSYKKPHLIQLCIDALGENISSLEYEIIVADGETGEQTYDLMKKKFPDIKFIPNHRNLGFSALVNQGIEAASGKFLYVINSDIIAKDNAPEKLLEFIKKNPKIGMVGPRLINFDNSIQHSHFKYYSILTVFYRRTLLGRFSFAKKHLDEFLMKRDSDSDDPKEVDWLMGSAMMMRREAIEQTGKMDDGFFMYFEDVDWCWRFWEKGWKVVFYPGAESFHYHGKQSANKNIIHALFFNKYTRIHIRSAIRFWFKHFGKPNPRLALENK